MGTAAIAAASRTACAAVICLVVIARLIVIAWLVVITRFVIVTRFVIIGLMTVEPESTSKVAVASPYLVTTVMVWLPLDSVFR